MKKAIVAQPTAHPPRSLEPHQRRSRKWGEGEFHLGDIGNVTVGEDGTGRIALTTNLWEMGTGSDVDIVGRGIIIHADPDDFTSQPTGNAGARIGCGAIEMTE